MPAIDELAIADEPAAWSRAGFDVRDGVCRVSRVRLRLAGRGERRGILGWTLGDEVAAEAAAPHPNGAVRVDHVVMLSPELDRTVVELESQGFDLRRRREGDTPGGSTRQAFFRAGEPILEVVQAPEGTSVARDPDGPARLWGSPSSWRTWRTPPRRSAPCWAARGKPFSPAAGSPRFAPTPGSAPRSRS